MDVPRILRSSITCGLAIGLLVIILTGSLLLALGIAALMAAAVAFGGLISGCVAPHHHKASPSREDLT
ncbi:hypothetical protein [Streptomyces sp. WAC08241]|uniref:hypothetical protein n=1 Tax=Streptomyces sp. WAC08241 TaxID=2487421 RepID=UPI000F7AA9C0|nr:hypothetical protein [Streptomyces sp. WAC08241]RSS43834.1 hypothetical protein EF906_08790 [Streptomyces sp. WAC08241]